MTGKAKIRWTNKVVRHVYAHVLPGYGIYSSIGADEIYKPQVIKFVNDNEKKNEKIRLSFTSVYCVTFSF